jgi:hypothetical protein
MGVNLSGWDRACSTDCDIRYKNKIKEDPSGYNQQKYRDNHLSCINKCFKVKPLSQRREFMWYFMKNVLPDLVS